MTRATSRIYVELHQQREKLRRLQDACRSQEQALMRNEVGDLEDQAADLTELNRLLELEDLERRELHRVDVALENLEHHQAGVCQSCGASIAPARLRAIPEAVLCVRCAEKAEQHGTVPRRG
jgi:DnaK suppressor protein